MLIVEGIHALNPVITDSLPSENLMKLYVSVSSRISDEDGDVLMSKRDLRFVRRLVRDYYHRASSVERTYDLWGAFSAARISISSLTATWRRKNRLAPCL